MSRRQRTDTTMVHVVARLWLCLACIFPIARAAAADAPPRYVVDPFWPKPLPNSWIVGQVAGIATDSQDHVWVLHRPNTLTEDERAAALTPPRAKCCVPAPPVLEFDAEGNLLKAWGGPGKGYDWPKSEHGIYIDPQRHVWIGGNHASDGQVLKFSPDGKFLLQIGRPGKAGGSNVTDRLGGPAHMQLDAQTNELFIADGYQNRRVIVFDAGTGTYKRHWGAYGKRPQDRRLRDHDPASPQFGTPVHCVRLARDGLVYVCDRANNRVQVFHKDGSYVRQFIIEPKTLAAGSVWDLIPSEDAAQRYLLIADGANNEVHIVVRETGERVGAFGRPGRHAGEFHWLHNIAIDSRGNVYTAEVETGKRAQKFTPAPGSAR